MKLFLKVLLGVLIYLVFMVAYMPANWLVSVAPIPNNIKLSGVSGTVWDGKADLVSIDRRQLEQVSWELNPWTLVLGKANIDFQIGSRASAVNGKGFVSLSMSGMSAEHIRFEAPSDFLLTGTRLPFRTTVNGSLSVIMESFSQGKPWCEQLKGKAFINGVDVNNQFGAYPLGDLALGMSCIDGKIQLAVNEADNTLGLEGTVTLAANSQLTVGAKIKPTDSQPEDLRKALSFLGQQDSQGYYPIHYSGRIPGM